MSGNQTTTFSEFNLVIRKLSQLKDKDCFSEYINAINVIRAYYLWSQKIYDSSNIQDVYLICSSGQCFGFIDCTYRELDITNRKPVSIYLNELQIAPSMQKKGIGKAVLNRLLSKGLNIELVVANQNASMLSLVNKFKNEQKYITADTRTIILST